MKTTNRSVLYKVPKIRVRCISRRKWVEEQLTVWHLQLTLS